MLAPRKKLWSTPIEAINEAILLLNVSSKDIVYDIGAGDGKFIIECHKQTDSVCIGIEIDNERVTKANELIRTIGLDINKCYLCEENALDCTAEKKFNIETILNNSYTLSDATCIYLYLIPRGLRLIYPVILSKCVKRPLRIVTFMNPLPDLKPVQIRKISTMQHQDAQWPLYLYIIN